MDSHTPNNMVPSSMPDGGSSSNMAGNQMMSDSLFKTDMHQMPMMSGVSGGINSHHHHSSSKQSMLPQDLFKKGGTSAQQRSGFQQQTGGDVQTYRKYGRGDYDQMDRDREQQRDHAEGNTQSALLGAGGLVLTTCYKLATNPEARLTTGCDMLTDFLRGGFVPKKLYEVYGESGSGKTQFAIQLLLQSLLPVNCGGLEGQSLYLMTGKPLNEKRFNEIKDNFLNMNRNKISEQDIHRKIIFSHCQTLEDYNKVFMNLSQRIENDVIKLVIIDNIQSVGDNFIKADGNVDFIERSNFLLKHAKNLKKLAHQYNLVVIILNNVSSDVNGNAGDPTRGFFQEKRTNVQPALGLLWSNCINERIWLKKKGHHGHTGGGGPGGYDNINRAMVIDKSCYLRRNEMDFEVHPGGVRGRQ